MPGLLVNVDVDDLRRAERFYAEAFGLSPGRRIGADAVEMLGLTAPLWLLAKAAGSRASSDAEDLRRYDRHWTPLHLDIVVDDIGAAVERAIAAGAVEERAARTEAWGKIALMADPFGHGFCLIEFAGRGYDEIAERRTD